MPAGLFRIFPFYFKNSMKDLETNCEWAPRYSSDEVEERIYRLWLDNGSFTASPSSGRKPYVIVIPPPNITGILTMGHVLNNTLQDILIRWQRMKGREALWVPGTDHAGIATQNVVEKELLKEGLNRRDLGREEFLRRVWDWRSRYGGTIITQLKRLGCSCDWSRERFTLDEGLSRAVEEVFIRLYHKGLVYRGWYLINWCPRCHTALSDEEVEHGEVKGSLWHIRYPLVEGKGGLVVATTRPETMLGDTAVAVNPADIRYRDFIGKTLVLPLTGRKIPVIADEYVDPAFGTGAVKVTPAHDPNDFLIGRRHRLPSLVVMDTSAVMNENAPPEFAGLDRFRCRKKVVQLLEAQGLIEKVEDHTHMVGHCYRCRTVIEPYLSEQWFVRMKPLAASALEAVLSGRIKFYPRRWIKVYQHWMENIRDWCISRQLWWGHRIPAWYRGEEVYVGRIPPEGEGWRRDDDVLDTWFSSWLWPFSTLGWPEEARDLEVFYPTTALVTAPDIIFFWVARMIVAGLEFRGDVPFREVYFTGIIRDLQGRKMSKSLGNSPDPLDVIREYGADALRFTIARLAPIGQDVYYSNAMCELGRNFANKIWNAARYIFTQTDGRETADPGKNLSSLTLDDRCILSLLQKTIRKVEDSIRRYHFNDAALALYDFFWRHFCDRYLEATKFQIGDGKSPQAGLTRGVLLKVLSQSLRLLHPFMPFITEEIGRLFRWKGLMISSAFPRVNRRLIWEEAESAAAVKYDLISAARNLRKDYELPVSRRLSFVFQPEDPALAAVLEREKESMAALIRNCACSVDSRFSPSGPLPSTLVDHCKVFMLLEGVVDFEQEKQRYLSKLEKTRQALKQVQSRLRNPAFLANAPAEVREKNQEREEALGREIEKINNILAQLQP